MTTRNGLREAVSAAHAEGVTRRVDHHPPTLGRRLRLRLGRAEARRVRLGFVEVLHRKVDVHLLWRIGIGPARRAVVLNAVSGHPDVADFERSKGIAGETDFNAEEFGVERREGFWI